jgi:DNA-binding CsgD family transcriptional regulator
MDGSYRLCSDQQKTMWARLSVFEGDWDLAAAEAVCSDDEIPATDVLRLLAQLTEKSIVVADTSGPRTRYRMLQTVRHYGRSSPGYAAKELHRKHRDHYLHVVDREVGSAFEDSIAAARSSWLDQIRAELPNLRAAINWSTATPGEVGSGLQLAVRLARRWAHLHLGITGDMLEWLRSSLAAVGSDVAPSLRIEGIALAGITALLDGSVDVARDLLEQCRAEADPADPALLLLDGVYTFLVEDDPRCLATLGAANAADLGHHEGLFALATGWYGSVDDAVIGAQNLQDKADRAGAEDAATWAMLIRGTAEIRNGNPGSALAELHRHREIRGLWGMKYATHMAAWATADLLGASPESLDKGIGEVDLSRHARRVGHLLGGARGLQDRSGPSFVGLAPFERADARAAAFAEMILGATTFATAFDEGRRLSTEDVMALTLDRPIPPAPDPRIDRHPQPWRQLTPTQKEIALLAAEGLSDIAIAQRRVCSVRTVEKHLENVRRKLLVSSRTEIDRWIPAEARSA